MNQCNACERSFPTLKGYASHWKQVHDPLRKIRDHHGVNNPHFGHKGRNHFTNFDWNTVPFEKLSWDKKRERLFAEANYTCPPCGFNKRRSDGHHVLEIDHIDGNHLNASRENLRVLCPNCHAMTPNFRNFGRSTKKTSTRFRKGNKGFSEASQLIKEQRLQRDEDFRKIVHDTHTSGEIDYSKSGWLQRLSEKLNAKTRKSVRQRLSYLMPEFYVHVCFRRDNNPKCTSVSP